MPEGSIYYSIPLFKIALHVSVCGVITHLSALLLCVVWDDVFIGVVRNITLCVPNEPLPPKRGWYQTNPGHKLDLRFIVIYPVAVSGDTF